MADEVDRMDLTKDGAREIERYRGYLRYLAQAHLDPRLHTKVSPSDLAQEVMITAWEHRQQFQDLPAEARPAWMRRVLSRKLANLARDFHRNKRLIDLEQSLDDALARSSLQLGSCLASPHSSPSQQAQSHEMALLLAEALGHLGEAQREVIVLHHLHGWSLKTMAEHLGRSESAIAGLLHRGLHQLRVLLGEGR